MATVRNNRESIVWLPPVFTGINEKTGKHIATPGPKGRASKLIPGLNDVDDDVLENAMKHQTCAAWFEGGGPAGKPMLVIEKGEPEDISAMKVPAAKALIAKSMDQMKLVYWLDRDSRKVIQEAIESRLTQLKAPSGSAAAATA
jgi:hypothetical protein